MIDAIKYFLLGLIQGFTEPLPISSSGHVTIFREIFNITFEENFLIIVNFGSLLAIIFYFRKMIKDLIVGSFNYIFKKNSEKQVENKANFIYVLLVALATIPAGIAGLLLEDFINANFNTLLSVGICLFITGTLVLFISYYSKNALRTTVTWSDALLMGIGQVGGLLPGISRSGSTTSVGVIKKLELTTALRFSFMMYIPISIASFLLGIYNIYKNGLESINVLGYILAFLASIIATFFSLKWFFRLVKKDNLKYFGFYCLVVSVLVLLYVMIV